MPDKGEHFQAHAWGRRGYTPPDMACFDPKACQVTASTPRKLKKTVKENPTPRGIKIDGFEHFTRSTAIRRRRAARNSIFPRTENVDKYPTLC